MENKKKIQWAVYEKVPQHGKYYNGIILAPYNTKEEAEAKRIGWGYVSDNYYVDIYKLPQP